MANWNIPSIYLPQVYGAVGNNTAVDDTAELQAMIDAELAAQVYTGLARSEVVIDGGDRIYTVSAPGIKISNSTTTRVRIKKLHLQAIGTWTSADYVLTNNSHFSVFDGVVIDCDDKSNGIKDNGSWTVWNTPTVFNMASAWQSRGFWNAAGTQTTINTPIIFQWHSSYDATKYADEANFTATCIYSSQSDVKVNNGSLSSARVLYGGDNGIHELNGVHMWNGRTGRAPESPLAVEFGKNGEGYLDMKNIYTDCCVYDVYGGSFHYEGFLLINNTRCTVSNGVFRLYKMAADEVKMTGHVDFVQYDTNPDLIKLIDYLTNVWPANQTSVATALNAAVANEGSKAGLRVNLNRRTFDVGFNVAGSCSAVFYPDNSWINWTNMTGGLQLPASAAEPFHTGTNYVAVSDGTPSNNRFGREGEMPYYKATNGNWYPMGQSVELLTIANNAVGTYACPRAGGFASITCEGQNSATSPSPQFSGEVWFDTGTSLAIIKGTAFAGVSGNFDVVTTNVTGTTGTAGNVTVAVQSGVLMIENRSGASRTFRISTR